MNKPYIIVILLILIYIYIYEYANDIEFFTFRAESEQDQQVANKGKTVFIIGSVHGNEPSGNVALTKFIEDLQTKKIILKSGTLIIVPKPNKIGLLLNNRFLLYRLYHRDLNRNFPINGDEKPLDPISTRICSIIQDVDWVIDFHEGWGYIGENNGSMGSGVFPGITPESINISKILLNTINKFIDNPSKKFGTKYNVNAQERTLKSYANYLGKNYILVETSGQNDIQPMHIRVKQIDIILGTFLKHLNVL